MVAGWSGGGRVTNTVGEEDAFPHKHEHYIVYFEYLITQIRIVDLSMIPPFARKQKKETRSGIHIKFKYSKTRNNRSPSTANFRSNKLSHIIHSKNKGNKIFAVSNVWTDVKG
eukprot:822115_1